MKSVIEHLKNYVISTNTILRETINGMEPIILLRNAHPTYRPDFAQVLVKDGIITKEQAEEFIRPTKK